MSVEKLPLGLGNIEVEPGTHIAFSYRDEQERARSLLAYIRAGLENGERCVAAVIEYTRDFWVQSLAELGVDAKPLLDKQLIILGPEELYAGGVDGMRSAARELMGTARDASREGWKSLRLCSGLTTLLQAPELVTTVLEGELENCRAMDRTGHIQLCTLSKDKLRGEIYDLCLSIHSALLVDGRIEPNPGFVGPDEYSRQLPDMVRRLKTAGLPSPPFASLGFEDCVPVLKVNGEMDVFTAPQLEDLGRSLSLVGHKHIVIDLSCAPFLDAAAISTILRLNSIARSKGGRLAVYDPEDPPRKIFELVHLDQVIPIRHSLRDAVCEAHG